MYEAILIWDGLVAMWLIGFIIWVLFFYEYGQ